MSRITNDCLTGLGARQRSGRTGCFIAVLIWQQWASKGFNCLNVCRLSVCSGVVLLADEMVSIGTVSLHPVILERSAEHQTVHTGRRCRWCGVVVNGNRLSSSRGRPARVADRFEVVFRRPHPLLVTYHEVAARPPAVDVLILCAPDSSQCLFYTVSRETRSQAVARTADRTATQQTSN